MSYFGVVCHIVRIAMIFIELCSFTVYQYYDLNREVKLMEKEKLSAIVSKAKTGNKQALNNLFTETYNDVYYFALKTVKDETLAADITQETFVTVFQNLETLNDPVAYPAWSRQITYRHCLQYLKKQNRETVVDENEDGSTIFDTIEEDRTEFIPDKQLDKDDFKRTVMDIVDGLPAEQRTAVMLYYFDELSVKQIAEIQDVSEGTVKSRLNYARKAIKSSVEEYEKKHNVKLHSVGIFPLLWWLFGNDAKACAMPTATVSTIASGVSATTGTTLSVSSVANIGSKILGALWQKIVAGILAAGIVTGGTVAVVNSINKNDIESTSTIQIGNVQQIEAEVFLAVNRSWQGYGKITSGLNLSSENEFVLNINRMNFTSIDGVLQVSTSDGSYYQREFKGNGYMIGDALYSGYIFYDIKLNEEVEKFYSDFPGYTELTLKYDPENNIFEFTSGPYEATLKSIE